MSDRAAVAEELDDAGASGDERWLIVIAPATIAPATTLVQTLETLRFMAPSVLPAGGGIVSGGGVLPGSGARSLTDFLWGSALPNG